MGTISHGSVPPSNIRILVASDVCLYREGLAQSLDGLDGVAVVGSASTALAAVERVLPEPPDVLLIDMSMPDSIRSVRRLADALPDLRIVAFAVAGDESDVVRFAEAGIDGYVPRDGSIDQLLAVVRHAARGETLCSPRVAGEAFRRLSALAPASAPAVNLSALTRREREILDLVAQGLTNKQIAKRLHIQTSTVKNHVHNLLKKLDVKGRREAAQRVRSAGRARRRDRVEGGAAP